MTDVENLITFTDAARDKDCGRTTVYRAAWDGRLNTIEVGDRNMIVKDEKYEAFEPEYRGQENRKSSSDSE